MSEVHPNVRALSSTILASTRFQSEMIYHTAKYHLQNDFVISPISMRALLTLISIGVVKSTHQELLKALGLKSSHYGAHEFKACRNVNRDDFTFNLSRAIFMNVRLDFALSFRTLCMEQYQTRIEHVDFANSEQSVVNINRWIAEQTEQRIETRIAASTLRAGQDNLLIDIASLDAKWIKPFPKKLETQEAFFLGRGSPNQVNIMHDFGELLYGELEDLKATAVFVPYKNVNVGLLIILPKAIDGLAEMEVQMINRKLDLTTVPMALKMKSVKLGLPKLKLECEIEMEQILRDMGIKAIFTESMDFSKLLGNLAIMKIAQIKHIACMEINEDGTAAASAKVSFLLTQPKDYMTMEVNHPFFFAVMDQERIFLGGHINEDEHFI